ncbi:hypothetical protein PBI_SCTP2_324 [Salicola phage SCTP-2]|nr:hypothetical protein PBI_SCTP2_324 [Salicola phage SCTP-2]
MVDVINKPVYVCEYCSKEYLKEKTCINHEKKCGSEKAKNDIIASFLKDKDYVRKNAKNIEHLIDLIKEQIYNKTGINVDVDIINVKYSKIIPNTHSCPIDGVRNWKQQSDRPVGYIGFTGRIALTITNRELKYLKENKSLKMMNDNILSHIITDKNGVFFEGVNTESGSANDKMAQYYVCLFLDDFPEMKKMWKKLKLEAEDDDHLQSLIWYRLM